MATRKLASTRQILNGDYDREIYEAMARAMFVSDWADRQEEKGKTYPGMDLMDVAPPTSRDALLAARALAAAVIKDNNVKSLTDLYARALNAGGEGDARKFGHYLAMQAMGHGVSWYDDGNPEFGLKLPHFEYYSGRGRVAQKLGHASGRRRIVHNPNLGQHDPARPLTEAERDALDESAAEGRAERWAGARAMGLNADDAYEHAIGSGRGRVAQKLGHAAGDSTEQLRVRIAEALKWTVKETESFSFPQLASFVRGKDAQLDADLARHIESASHWFKPARRSRRKGFASGKKARLTIAEAEKGIRSLARQDVAGGVDDSFARTGNAEDTIRRWQRSASEAGDQKLVDIIKHLGVPRAAAVYRQARKSGKGLASGKAAAGSAALRARGYSCHQETVTGQGHMGGDGVRCYRVRDAKGKLVSPISTHRSAGEAWAEAVALTKKGSAGHASGKTKAKRTRVKASCACSATAVVRKKSKKTARKK